jgi:hypothetical protein
MRKLKPKEEGDGQMQDFKIAPIIWISFPLLPVQVRDTRHPLGLKASKSRPSSSCWHCPIPVYLPACPASCPVFHSPEDLKTRPSTGFQLLFIEIN